MNKAILMGRLVRDPELRTTQNGVSVVSFTLAVDRRFKNAQGERETDFIPCVAWRTTAEFVAKWFAQGQRMAVVGSIQPRSWDDDQGNKRYTTEVIVDEAYFADSKKSDDYSGGSYNYTTAQTAEYTGPKSYQPQAQAQQTADTWSQQPLDDDTEMPFDL